VHNDTTASGARINRLARMVFSMRVFAPFVTAHANPC